MKKMVFISLLASLAVIGEAGTVAYWRFEEGQGNAIDSVVGYGLYQPTWSDNVPTNTIPLTGEANNGAISGGSTLTQGGAPIVLEDQFTIECYLNLTSMYFWEAGILGFGGRFQSSALYLHLVNFPEDEDETVRFAMQSQSNFYTSDPFDFVYNEWFHFAFVKDDDWTKFYINGNLLWEFEGGLEDYYAWGNWMDNEMTIGSWWNGYIDEFRISDVALNPNQFLNAVAIPEPSTFAFLALGSGILTWRKRRQRP